ncbi:RNA polymerase sigma factor [Candidatus Protofrankia californiensis]|uniref:RNA polymerase sigma factor n=1 Tax=Candidatus Protofrankia californiensis TaxID=1839754 RepID=UPI003D32878F
MSGGDATTVGVGIPRRRSFADTAAAPQDGYEPPAQEPEPQVGPADISLDVAEAQRGDEDAFKVIYRAVQPGLLRYLRVLVGDDAEDVASEAWLQIARDLPSFRGDSNGFRGWAVTIARHRALDHIRRQRRRPQHDVPVEHMTDLASPDDTAGRALETLSTDAAIRLIAGLPRDQAEAVLLRVVIGLDAQTAGRVLGKRAGAVRTAAYRGLRRLAEQLGPGGSTTVGEDGRGDTMRPRP